MKNKPENIPAGIFDWILSIPFEKLTSAQKAEVLLHLDEKMYDELHATAMGITGTVNIPVAKGKPASKNILLEKFDAHHRQKKGVVVFMRRPVALWKAAAIVVLVLSAWLYFYTPEKKENPGQLVAQVDTVYVTKEITTEPVKIHDTIYITKYASTKNKKDTAIKSQTTVVNNDALPVNQNNAGIIPVEALGNKQNQPRGNSMKDDTLLKKFSFVTM